MLASKFFAGGLSAAEIVFASRRMKEIQNNGYEPSTEFEVDALEPLVDLDLTESMELWLMQWPINQAPEFEGKEMTLKLGEDGQLGTVEDSSGRTYDLISFAAQEGDATVILPSGTEAKVVGKISRRVSLVRYPEPEELEALNSKSHQRLAGALTDSSNMFSTPTQSSRFRGSNSALRHPASRHSSRHKSSLSGVSEKSKVSKRKHSGGSSLFSDSLGKTHSSTTTFSGSHSGEAKSKKRIKANE